MAIERRVSHALVQSITMPLWAVGVGVGFAVYSVIAGMKGG